MDLQKLTHHENYHIYYIKFCVGRVSICDWGSGILWRVPGILWPKIYVITKQNFNLQNYKKKGLLDIIHRYFGRQKYL